MFTKRLYFENAYIKEFDARVLSCEEGKNGYEIVLDETAFFSGRRRTARRSGVSGGWGSDGCEG